MQKPFNILFSVFILLLSVYHYDYWTNGNTVSRAVFVKAVVDDGSLNVDKYHEQSIDIAYVNGHYYSDKAPLPAIITMPFYYFLQKIGFTKGNDLIYTAGNFLAGSLPFALIILLTFFFMQQKDPKPENVFLCSLPFIGSFVFIYSGTFFAHALTSFLVLAAYILIRKKENYFLAGLVSGMAVLCEYPVFIIAAIWAIQILVNKKKLKPVLLFISAGIPFGIFLLFYNYKITGNAFDFLYNHQQNFPAGAENLGFSKLPRGEALFQLSIGIYRGILFFAPALIALLFIFFRFKNFRNSAVLKDYFILPCIIYFLAICTNVAWYGGWCYGPRYLSAIAVLLLFEGCTRMSHQPPGKKALFYFFTSIGLLFAWMAKSTVVYSLPTEEKNPVFNILIPEFFKGKFNENNLLSLLFNASPVTGNLLFPLILLAGLYFFYHLQKRSAIEQPA
ncbi:MAG TPA: hypothetical protein VJY62_00160 [Bacteroidia bacterium]|nr:hypothetical protein [Bacteroidia bacterium]